MSEMLERVARAMEAARWGLKPEHVFLNESALEVAKVAIQTMLEPTEAMIEAGRQVAVQHAWSSSGEHVSDPEWVWRAMLDEALR